jgi:hypothetical protein
MMGSKSKSLVERFEEASGAHVPYEGLYDHSNDEKVPSREKSEPSTMPNISVHRGALTSLVHAAVKKRKWND